MNMYTFVYMYIHVRQNKYMYIMTHTYVNIYTCGFSVCVWVGRVCAASRYSHNFWTIDTNLFWYFNLPDLLTNWHFPCSRCTVWLDSKTDWCRAPYVRTLTALRNRKVIFRKKSRSGVAGEWSSPWLITVYSIRLLWATTTSHCRVT